MRNSTTTPTPPAPLLQRKLYAYYPVCKRRPHPALSPPCLKRLKGSTPAACSPWCLLYRQQLPLDVLLTLVQFLGFAESMHGFGSVCLYWRFAWKVFLGLSTDYFRQLSSISDQ